MHTLCYVSAVACVAMLFQCVMPERRKKRESSESAFGSPQKLEFLQTSACGNEVVVRQKARRPRLSADVQDVQHELACGDEWGQFVIIDFY